MKYWIGALGLLVGVSGGMSFLSHAVPAHQPLSVIEHVSAAKSPAAKKPAEAAKPAAKTAPANYRDVQALDLVKKPDQWLGKKVSFKGTFVTFSPFALDYKKAMRPSKDYISFLIKRPDVDHHTIPLSELKLIYPRSKADSVMDLGSGDKVLVKGEVFSSAMGDPWMDVEDIVVVEKNPENIVKDKKKSNPDLEE